MEYKKKGRDGVRAANARMKEQGKGLFAPGVAERGRKIGARAGGLVHAQQKTGVCAPGQAQKGGRAFWDDPVYREMMRWNRTPYSAWKKS